MGNFTTLTAYEGERWDSLSMRAYGDPMRAREIMDANPEVDITDTLSGGMVLYIPIDTTTKSAAMPGANPITTPGLPPWMQ
jgi:Phage Tail Protein X